MLNAQQILVSLPPASVQEVLIKLQRVLWVSFADKLLVFTFEPIFNSHLGLLKRLRICLLSCVSLLRCALKRVEMLQEAKLL